MIPRYGRGGLGGVPLRRPLVTPKSKVVEPLAGALAVTYYVIRDGKLERGGHVAVIRS
jgi:hypothetical protein